MSTETKCAALTTLTHSVSILHHAADEGVVERRYADSLQMAKGAIAELIAAAYPFARRNSSEPTVPVTLKTEDVTSLRAALAKVEGVA